MGSEFGSMTIQSNGTSDGDRTIRLAEHLAFSRSFQPLFNQGMALVDETAIYLDGAGRVEAKALSKHGTTLYAAESMRLTTRLMQVASWLLLQRAANQGDFKWQGFKDCRAATEDQRAGDNGDDGHKAEKLEHLMRL